MTNLIYDLIFLSLCKFLITLYFPWLSSIYNLGKLSVFIFFLIVLDSNSRIYNLLDTKSTDIYDNFYSFKYYLKHINIKQLNIYLIL